MTRRSAAHVRAAEIATAYYRVATHVCAVCDHGPAMPCAECIQAARTFVRRMLRQAAAERLYPRCCPKAAQAGFLVPGPCPYCGANVGES